MDLSKKNFPGSTPESKHRKTDSGPDVAIDGSIKRTESHESEEEAEKTSWWKRILPW
jgi:hypothetical protein